MARVRDNASAGNLVIEGADRAGEALIESQKSSRTALWRNPTRGSAPRSTTRDDGRAAAARDMRRILELEQQGAMSLRERLAERVATPPKYRVLLFGVYLTDDLEHLAPGNRSRIEIALNF